MAGARHVLPVNDVFTPTYVVPTRTAPVWTRRIVDVVFILSLISSGWLAYGVTQQMVGYERHLAMEARV